MVRKFFRFLYDETQTLNHAAFLLGFFALLSQILAFLRDRLLAHIFGASTQLDIYYAAFRVPDFIFVTAASIVSLSVLVPFIIEREGQGRDVLREFIDKVFSFFSCLIILVAGLAFLFIPKFSPLLFKGFSPQALDQVIFLSRLLLLSPIILGISNLFGSLTQAYNRFTIYALAPLLYNSGIILGIIVLGERLGVLGVAIGVIGGASLHALVQVPFVLKMGLFPRFTFVFDRALVGKVVKISFPRTLTLSMSALTLLFLTSLASLMPEGSISVLTLSTNLQSVPLSIIGVSYSLAAFPTLTRRFQERNVAAFLDQMAESARFIIFWSLPVTALLIVLRAQIVRVILGTGQFDWHDTRLTAAALALFVFSALFQSLLLLLMRGFYSAGFTWKPFFVNLLSSAFLISFAYGFVKIFYASRFFGYFVSALLKVEDLPDAAVLMLPLGFTMGTILNGILLWWAFEREFAGFSKRIYRALFESLGASVIMGATAYAGLIVFSQWFETSTLMGIFLQGFLAGIAAIIVGVAVFYALGNKELVEVWRSVHARFWRAKVIATDPEIV